MVRQRFTRTVPSASGTAVSLTPIRSISATNDSTSNAFISRPPLLLRNTCAGHHCRRYALAPRSRDQNRASSRIALPHTQLYLSALRDESTPTAAHPAVYAPPVTQRPQICRATR